MSNRTEVLSAVRRRGRVIGIALGTCQVTALSFIGLLVTRIAADLGTTEDIVTGAATLGLSWSWR